MTDTPSTAARILDAAALVLAGGGATVYLAAHAGMRRIVTTQVHVATIEAPNLTRWEHYRTMSNIGLVLVAAGIAVGVIAYFRNRLAPGPNPGALPDGPPLAPPNAPIE